MAFSKFANAAVARPVISMAAWDEVRGKALALGPAFSNREAQQMLVQRFDPQQYMLSHCTIIASVDTEAGPGPLGRQVEGGFQLDRRHADYYITPQTSKYVNNNQDSWERKLLLGTFRTFIGGQNYVEHLQIPEMSKGRIIDAAARDIGDSIYVDILVATELKHRPLISAIRSKQLSTLSMGCTVAYTMCSKCGNVAEDETQLCPHIRYMKGNSFIDGLGKVRKIAELCGHSTDPQSVKFIEASWVANPAFTGAVLRDILTPEELATVGDRMQVAFSLPAPVADPSLRAKAARDLRMAQVQTNEALRIGKEKAALDALLAEIPVNETPRIVREVTTPHHFYTVLGEEQTQGAPPQGSPDFGGPAPKKEEDPFDKAVTDVADSIRERALKKVREEMSPEKEETPRADLAENENNTLIHQASQSPHWRSIARVVLSKVQSRARAGHIVTGLMLFKSGGWHAVREAKSFSGREVLAISRFLDEFQGSSIAGETRVYRTVLAVGGVSPYGDVDSYFAACRRIYGRELTTSERDALITKGRLYDLGVS